VKTKSPMKILFWGLTSKKTSSFIAECGLQNASPPPQPSPLEGEGEGEGGNLLMKDSADRNGMPG